LIHRPVACPDAEKEQTGGVEEPIRPEEPLGFAADAPLFVAREQPSSGYREREAGGLSKFHLLAKCEELTQLRWLVDGDFPQDPNLERYMYTTLLVGLLHLCQNVGGNHKPQAVECAEEIEPVE